MEGQVIAVSGTRQVIAIDDEQGFVRDTATGKEWEPHGLASILAHGTWQEVDKKGGEGSGYFGHAGRPGEIGGSAAGFVTAREVAEMGIVKGTRPAFAQALINTVERARITKDHLAGIKCITDETPATWRDAGYHYESANDRTRTAAGFYEPKTATVYVHGHQMDVPAEGARIMAHEIGHAVMMEPIRSPYEHFVLEQTARHALALINDELAPTVQQGPRAHSDVLAKYGLRDYSLTHTDEFLADVYMARRFAGDKALDNLDKLLTKAAKDAAKAQRPGGKQSFREIANRMLHYALKERTTEGALVVGRALEIVSHEEDGIIVTSLEPTDATQEEIDATPWFFVAAREDTKERGWWGPENAPEGTENPTHIKHEDLPTVAELSGEQDFYGKERYGYNSDRDMKWGADPLTVKGITVWIDNGGVGHFPRLTPERQTATSEYNTLKVVVGPKEWVGHDMREIPELREGLEAQYRAALSGKMDTGNFSQVQPTTYNGQIAKLMYGYKTPLTTAKDATYLQALAKAYLDNGQVEAIAAEVDFLEKELAMWDKIVKDQPSLRELDMFKKQQSDEYQIPAKLRAISRAREGTAQVDQEMCNQFVGEIKKTQEDLATRFPSGKVTLYRGVQGDYAKAVKTALKKSDEVDINMYPISSWSESIGTAQKFAGKKGVVITQEVDTKDVAFSHYTTPYIDTSWFPFGGEEEWEFLVLSRTGRMRVRKENVA